MGHESAPSRLAFGRSVPATAANVAPIRHSVVELALRAGAADHLRTDLALAVGEACANVVVHAYPPGDVGWLIVEAQIEGDEIVVRVMDQGRGMVPRPDSPGLGLGLPLIANVADRLEIGDGPDGIGTALTMTFALRRARTSP